MSKSTLLSFLFAFLCLAAVSQSNSPFEKECRITVGTGFAAAAKNTQSVGGYFWLQLDYKVLKNISIATEFENMGYKLPGYDAALPAGLNEIHSVDNNSSLLLKYHLPIQSALKIALASGWTYTVRTHEFYIHETTNTGQRSYREVSSFDDFQIPLLLELEYPLWKTINAQARVKYNSNPQNGNTYSSGIGLSLKL